MDVRSPRNDRSSRGPLIRWRRPGGVDPAPVVSGGRVACASRLRVRSRSPVLGTLHHGPSRRLPSPERHRVMRGSGSRRPSGCVQPPRNPSVGIDVPPDRHRWRPIGDRTRKPSPRLPCSERVFDAPGDRAIGKIGRSRQAGAWGARRSLLGAPRSPGRLTRCARGAARRGARSARCLSPTSLRHGVGIRPYCFAALPDALSAVTRRRAMRGHRRPRPPADTRAPPRAPCAPAVGRKPS